MSDSLSVFGATPCNLVLARVNQNTFNRLAETEIHHFSGIAVKSNDLYTLIPLRL
jgi:hypothetical protein